MICFCWKVSLLLLVYRGLYWVFFKKLPKNLKQFHTCINPTYLLHWYVSVHIWVFFLVKVHNFTIASVNHEKRRIETPIERYPTPLFHFLHSSPDGAGGRAILPHPILPPPLFLPQILLPQIISHPSNPPSGPSKSEDLIWHSCDTRRHLSATPSIKLAFFLSIPQLQLFFINPPSSRRLLKCSDELWKVEGCWDRSKHGQINCTRQSF